MEKPIFAAVLSCSGFHLTDEEKRIFSKYNPLGITLFKRNIETPTQIKSLIKEIKETIGRDNIFIAVDQEGGRVRRLTEPYFHTCAANCQIGALPLEKALIAAELHAKIISADLHSCGINLNYAPVLDLSWPETTPALQSRCFSSQPEIVATLGKKMTETYMVSGIIPCIKHMPGHGRAHVDPHLYLPILNYPLKELAPDFYPFQQLNTAPLGMTAHILFPMIDEQLPLTMSKKGIDSIIRGEIGFTGLLMSDSIEMSALQGSLSERTDAALHAGCDFICYSLGYAKDLVEICQTKNYIADKTLNKIAKLKKLFENKHGLKNLKQDTTAYQQLMGEMPPYEENYDATEVLNRMRQKA